MATEKSTTGLCWLASYPKSGNTWMRAMLSAARSPDQIVQLDSLEGGIGLDSVSALTEAAGVDVAMLSPAELATLRYRFFRSVAAETPTLRFVKTHLANASIGDRGSLFDQDCGRSIYIVRDPFDVALSYANYVAMDPSDIVTLMCDDDTVLDRWGTARPMMTAQPLQSWASHVMSWLEAEMPVLVVRYEDMLADAAAVLTDVDRFLQLNLGQATIEKVVAATTFNRLAALEATSGFAERTPLAKVFFRSGRSGEGQSMLDPADRSRLHRHASEVMERLGYPTDA